MSVAYGMDLGARRFRLRFCGAGCAATTVLTDASARRLRSTLVLTTTSALSALASTTNAPSSAGHMPALCAPQSIY